MGLLDLTVSVCGGYGGMVAQFFWSLLLRSYPTIADGVAVVRVCFAD